MIMGIKNNSFLRGCNNIMDIVKKAKYDSDLIFFYSFLFFRIFKPKNTLEKYISIFKRVENCYKIFTDEISMIPLIKNEQIELLIVEHLKEKDTPESDSLEEFKKSHDTESIEIKELILKVKGKTVNLNEKVSNMNFVVKFF